VEATFMTGNKIEKLFVKSTSLNECKLGKITGKLGTNVWM
jgi:hypothetical protein